MRAFLNLKNRAPDFIELQKTGRRDVLLSRIFIEQLLHELKSTGCKLILAVGKGMPDANRFGQFLVVGCETLDAHHALVPDGV